MLIEIHVLQNHAPSNLNRDESGSPKESVFGGYRRARISSQCLKRSIRRSPIYQHLYAEQLKEFDPAVRVQGVPTLMGTHLRGNCQADETEVADIISLLPRLLASTEESEDTTGDASTKDETDTSATKKASNTKQLVFTSAQEYEAIAEILLEQLRSDSRYFKSLLDDRAKEIKKKRATFSRKVSREMVEKQDAQSQNIRNSPDIALFGRMTTSAVFVDVQAALQAAHGISTNRAETEFDFFTAVDDLKDPLEDDPGAGHLNDTEFNSACYYKYFSIHVDGLLDNILDKRRRKATITPQMEQEARKTTAQVLSAFVRAMTMTTPTGKQNSFAAHQLPAAILVEVRPYPTPVSYANAFVDPARPGQFARDVRETTGHDPDLTAVSLFKFKKHVEALTNGFNLETTHRWLLAPEFGEFEHEGNKRQFTIEGVKSVNNLNDLCQQVHTVVESGNGGSNG